MILLRECVLFGLFAGAAPSQQPGATLRPPGARTVKSGFSLCDLRRGTVTLGPLALLEREPEPTAVSKK